MDRSVRERLVGTGTLIACLLIWLAFDDITTDNSSSFVVEYTLAAVCAAGLAMTSAYLLMTARGLAGGVSLLLLAAGMVAQNWIGPGTRASLNPVYLTPTIGWLWFATLGATMAYRGLTGPGSPLSTPHSPAQSGSSFGVPPPSNG